MCIIHVFGFKSVVGVGKFMNCIHFNIILDLVGVEGAHSIFSILAPHWRRHHCLSYSEMCLRRAGTAAVPHRLISSQHQEHPSYGPGPQNQRFFMLAPTGHPGITSWHKLTFCALVDVSEVLNRFGLPLRLDSNRRHN